MAPIIKSDSGSVDSSSIISALGFTPFNETGDTLTGTGGSGFYGAIPQSSSPSTPGSGFRLYANASGLFEWKGTNGFTRTFDGATNTANRTYTLPDASGTIALEGTLTSLANPTIQNGVYQFAQNTKPTQRAVGVSLVAGDRWYKTDDGTEWFWNGTYWCGNIIEEVVPVGPRSSDALPDNTNSNFTLPVRRPFLLQNVKWRFGAVAGNHSVTNHWILSFREAKGGGAANNTQLLSYNSTAFVENPVASINNHEVVLNLNTFFNLAETTVWDYIAYKVGAPHNIVGNSVTFTHRLVQL